MNEDRLHESLRIHEGVSLKMYKDTTDHWSIGIGHNLENGISIKQAYLLLEEDIAICLKELDRYFPGWDSHDDARQNVLIEMCFNMGAPRLTGFKKMWAALANHDYKSAAAEMLDSQWAKQVGQRAITLSKQMRDGWAQEITG